MGMNREVSRRTLLGTAAAAGVGGTLLSQLSDAQARADSGQVLSRFGNPTAPVPAFSIAERDRRWAAVAASWPSRSGIWM